MDTWIHGYMDTWIPYKLASPAEVTLHIYVMNGTPADIARAIGFRAATHKSTM